MTISNWNFATNMIPGIRSRMNDAAIVDGLPPPTDDEVRLEMYRVFDSMGKVSGNSALRGPVSTSGDYQLWWVEDRITPPDPPPLPEEDPVPPE